MNSILATSPVRIARATSSLSVIERFWVNGVGLDVLWREDDPPTDGHALLMVGPSGATWHLELVGDPVAASSSNPGPEDLLVLYLGEHPDRAWLERIQAHGGELVSPRNPYWEQWGVTIRDPDGYLLVLSHRTWDD